MNIYDLINMKKDIFINGYSTLSTLEESYDYSPEEEYLNTICENFDLSLENANLQLFHYGSEEYIYEVLEENEYWDITEEGVISAVGEGIKKIIESILNLIKKIFSFIGNLFSKILGIFDRGSSEMDEVDKAIEEFNKEIEKMAKESDKINDKFDDELKNTTNKATDDIKKHLEDKLKKENELDDRKYNARLKALDIKNRREEMLRKQKEQKEKNIYAKNTAKSNGIYAYGEKTMKKRAKDYKKNRAHEKRDLYGHNLNAKVNPKLNGPQSLDSLYNTFGKEIKIKCGILKTPEEHIYGKYGEVFDYGVGRLLTERRIRSKGQDFLRDVQDKLVYMSDCKSIDKLKQKMIQDANKSFVKNYEDDKPFDRDTKISEIPLQVIKWYAYNVEDLTRRVNSIEKIFKNDLKDAEDDIKKIEEKYCSEKYKNEYENIKKNNKETEMSSPEEVKKRLNFVRSLINDYTIFHKTYVTNVTRAYTTSIKICKMLTKQLFVKNEN